jgi:hypothetical protein
LKNILTALFVAGSFVASVIPLAGSAEAAPNSTSVRTGAVSPVDRDLNGDRSVETDYWSINHTGLENHLS